MAIRTLSTNASEVAPKNTQRVSMVLKNEDSSISIYIKLERSENTTVSSTDHDYLLRAGDAIALNSQNDGKASIQSRVTAIAASGSPVISFLETEDVIR